MSDRKDISELGNNLANLSVRPSVFIGADHAGELQDVTTLSDSHKRFIRVNCSMSKEDIEELKVKFEQEGRTNSGPLFLPADDFPHLANPDECAATGEGHYYKWEHIPQEYIDGNENGPGERVLQCQFCGETMKNKDDENMNDQFSLNSGEVKKNECCGGHITNNGRSHTIDCPLEGEEKNTSISEEKKLPKRKINLVWAALISYLFICLFIAAGCIAYTIFEVSK